MKTNWFLTTQFRLTRTFAQLFAMLLMPMLFCQGQDASCKVVADAQVSLMRTPHHSYSTETRGGHTVLSEGISTPGGVFWGTGGVWHRSTFSMEELAKDSTEKVKELRDCRHVADEAVNGGTASRYSFHNSASGGDETAWIGKGNGLVLKSEVRLADRQISSRYEYTNVQAPANVR
jgi:hypothetical protein